MTNSRQVARDAVKAYFEHCGIGEAAGYTDAEMESEGAKSSLVDFAEWLLTRPQAKSEAITK